MNRISPSLLLTWLITALAAVLAWFVVPGSSLDRWAFIHLAGSPQVAHQKFEGSGSHASPWQVSSKALIIKKGQPTTTVALNDNLEGVFQASPHAPIDMAVIFNNLQRLGTRKLACSVLLAWNDPDPIGLAAMESALLNFETVVLAAPVTRGAMMETMPPSFRRASLSENDVRGDLSALPKVNRIPLASLIHGGKNAVTGFEVIDSEPNAEQQPLMARWDDRIIFSFPVLVAAQHLGIEVSDLSVQLGSHLQFGNSEYRLPIDEFGRLLISKDAAPLAADLAAEELIDAKRTGEELLKFEKTLIRDSRSHADINSRDFNRTAPVIISKILTGQAHPEPKHYGRVHSVWEVLMLLTIATGLSFTSLFGRGKQSLACGLMAACSLLGGWIGVSMGLWLPGLAAVIATSAAWMASMCIIRDRKRTTSMPRLERLEFREPDQEKER